LSLGGAPHGRSFNLNDDPLTEAKTNTKIPATTATIVDRRRMLLTSPWVVAGAGVATGAFLGIVDVDRANAADEVSFMQIPQPLVTGTVSLAPGSALPLSPSGGEEGGDIQPVSTQPALYITCRPDRVDNVPAAILNGTRGKPPPVLSARFENPTFPFEFALSAKDVTLEGGAAEDENKTSNRYWWNSEPSLIVSARWDSDGVAATRSPEDLVGRGVSSKRDTAGPYKVDFTLGGRGAFGKFATQKGKK
jgi:hypothetical protein